MSIAVKMVLKSRDKKRVVWNAGNGGGMQCVGCGSAHILRPHPYPDLSRVHSRWGCDGPLMVGVIYSNFTTFFTSIYLK